LADLSSNLTHSHHAGRDIGRYVSSDDSLLISIHSHHAGRDWKPTKQWELSCISIHSPHAGRDKPISGPSQNLSNFNPLSPCGERHGNRHRTEMVQIFQSTLPMRGETLLPPFHICFFRDISIHSPHAGRDQAWGLTKFF